MIHSGTFLTTRMPDEVFDVLEDSQRFTPLLPFFESMTVQDATHFTLRIAITVAQINAHADLAMELGEALRPSRIEYRGQGTVAGSQLKLNLQFCIAPTLDATEVHWQGEFSLDGMLALMAGRLIEPMGRGNFELMAERLQNGLRENASGDLLAVPPSASGPPDPNTQS